VAIKIMIPLAWIGLHGG